MPRLPYELESEADLAAAQDYAANLPVQLPKQYITPEAAQEYYNRVGNLITNNDPTLPTILPGVREDTQLLGQKLRGEAPPNEKSLTGMTFGRVGRFSIPIDYDSEKRHQLWPEKIVRNALGGEPASYSIYPDTGKIHTSPETITRAMDIAGMAGGSSLGAKVNTKPPLINWEKQTPDWVTMRKQEQQQAVNGRLMSDTAIPGAAVAALAPRFYSALENAVKNLTHTKSATADEWISSLRKQPGVKQEEIDWVLHDLPEGQISKSDLEHWINEHKVELKEINLGEMKFNENSKYNLPTVKRASREAGNNPGELELTLANDSDAYRALMKKFPELAENENWAKVVADDFFGGVTKPDGTTKYDKYQLPGGRTNYREHLLTLPDRQSGLLEARNSNLQKIEDLRQSMRGTSGTNEIRAEIRKLQNENDVISKQISENPNFKDHHYADQDIANVVVHARTNDRVISSVGNSLHIEIGQSDWHQKGRSLGYKLDKSKERRFTDIDNKLINSNVEDILGNPDLKAAINEAVKRNIITAEEGKFYNENSKGDHPNAVPNAPFKKEAWVDVILKNMIRKAAEEGKDAISWTPGDAQYKRWESIAKGDGEFLKRLYDETYVNKANAIAKKFGGKVEPATLDIKKIGKVVKQDEMKWKVEWNDGTFSGGYGSKDAAERALELRKIDKQEPVHVLRITPQLRDAALNKGFSLFADSGKAGAPLAALSRVEHNPFALGELEKQHGVKLTPVENPFTTDAYHGSPNAFRGTEIAPSSRWTGNSEFYSTPNPDLANEYAAATWYGGKQKLQRSENVTPLKLDTKDYHTVDAKGKYWHEINDQAIFDANQMGKKGVIVKDVYDGANKPNTIYITLDPSTVRSKFAKFDPQHFHESGLLKASGLPIYSDENGNPLMQSPVNPARIPALEPDPHYAAIGAAKAAEWLAFLGTRNYPKINGPLTAVWISQWPMMQRMLKDDIKKQLDAGKKPSEIEFDEGSVGDMFGVISTLRKKFGVKANQLTPVDGNPF